MEERVDELEERLCNEGEGETSTREMELWADEKDDAFQVQDSRRVMRRGVGVVDVGSRSSMLQRAKF